MTAAAATPSATKQVYEQAKAGTITPGMVYRLRGEGPIKTNCWAQVLAVEGGKVSYYLWPKIGPAQSIEERAFRYVYALEEDEGLAGKVRSGLFSGK
jgi:hypothetical protein